MEMNQFIEKYSIDRFGTNSLKWDALQQRFGDPDLISMWVADMEFRTPECVVEALKNRVEHGIIHVFEFISGRSVLRGPHR